MGELKGAQEPEVVYCHEELKRGLIWGYKCVVVAGQSGVERGGGWAGGVGGARRHTRHTAACLAPLEPVRGPSNKTWLQQKRGAGGWWPVRWRSGGIDRVVTDCENLQKSRVGECGGKVWG